jgi:UDP-perosamine 4-acetyltransferase
MLRVVGLGAGGHAAVLIETLRFNPKVEIVGLLAGERVGGDVLGVPILGGDDRLPELQSLGVCSVFLGVGMMGEASVRRRLVGLAEEHGLQILGAIHPSAQIAPSASLGNAAQVLAGTVVQSRTLLGDHVLVNSGALVEHDCIVGDYAHIATGARIAGGVQVGTGSLIGVGATVLQGIRIGRESIVGAGAVVVRDLPDRSVVVGVPARPIERQAERVAR